MGLGNALNCSHYCLCERCRPGLNTGQEEAKGPQKPRGAGSEKLEELDWILPWELKREHGVDES